MKRMKQVLAVLTVVVLTSSFANAQRLGVKGGVNFSKFNLSGEQDLGEYDNKIIPGFHLGAVINYPLNDFIVGEAGLLLSSKGTKLEASESGTYFSNGTTSYTYSAEVKGKFKTYYFDIPITVKSFFELDNDLRIFGTTGFNIGFGISGKTTYEETVSYSGESVTESDTDGIEWGNSDEDQLKRGDLSWVIGAGLELNETIQINLTYNVGLANIYPDIDDDIKCKNNVFQISVVYLLNDLDLF